ncbi:MAG: TIR domain-containing protein [Desulfobulbaceae bacterium]|nr:TIR domain-containing protein [Desulfobulbaceae bacterium]
MAKRVYFAFHYQDVIDFRVNVVRNHNALTSAERAGYFDASIWEESKKQGDLALKRMINSELKNTSVTAVLIGSQTYARTWVQYEIFKSIEVGNSLIGIHINSIKGKDEKTKGLGPNPLNYCGLRISDDGNKVAPIIWTNGSWYYFSKLGEFSIKRLPEEYRRKNVALSTWYPTYDWVGNNGNLNFKTWIS